MCETCDTAMNAPAFNIPPETVLYNFHEPNETAELISCSDVVPIRMTLKLKLSEIKSLMA